MNSSRPFTRTANNFFRPAFSLLNNSPKPARSHRSSHSKKTDGYTDAPYRRKNSASSIDDTDNEDIEHYAAMDHSRARNSSSELQPAVPLIDVGSRSTSPYPRVRSAAQSEDEDDDFEPADSIRPLVAHDVGRGSRGSSFRGIWREGGLGGFFFGTWMGWQIWVALLVFWVGGCGFGLLLMNRFILLTGVYKFPFPLAHSYLQLVLTHTFLVAFASLTRGLGTPLRRLGFGAAVAPAYPVATTGGGFRTPAKQRSTFMRFGNWLTNGSGGIAGGGLFEFDLQVAKQVLPLAFVFSMKVVLSNFSFAYAPLEVFQLARIGVTPAAFIFSCILSKENHSGSTLSSALSATLFLLFASLKANQRVTEESIVAGVFSSFFTALYPILLLRTYRALVSSLAPQGDFLTGYPSSTDDTSNREETRAYYRVLHYTSLLTIILLTPLVLISGGVGKILHDLPFLDLPFFWFMIWCGTLGSFSVFTSTLLLVKATSPLTATFVAVPRSACQLVFLNMFKLSAHSWTGVVLCWISSLWFLVARRDEGRTLDRLRLEGR
ncbi:hypothetical protein P280DRAFT_467946 [Massarina eburnea CBS 473.64]|uniref:GDP-mannose transporter n=1 Tax=Massarina eburnea CBS 473.64 TaxID=1395130 RepID=A0A6A6S4X4_9PLEO|nr:hypothetical protein P280DRAFT_467946 [Massarina eburnea CBS 473.64]